MTGPDTLEMMWRPLFAGELLWLPVLEYISTGRYFVMTKMMAFCGLCCSLCPTFLATRNNDDNARKQTADMYAQKFGLVFAPEDINCDGCLSDSGTLISYCRDCKIRDCGQTRGVDNCAACPDQPCEKLMAFHSFSPEAKAGFNGLLKQKH